MTEQKIKQKYVTDGLFVRTLHSPHLVAQVIKIQDDRAAKKFFGTPHNRNIVQVPDYNIFLMHIPNKNKPFIPEPVLLDILGDMAAWYYEEKIKSNKTVKRLYAQQVHIYTQITNWKDLVSQFGYERQHECLLSAKEIHRKLTKACVDAKKYLDHVAIDCNEKSEAICLFQHVGDNNYEYQGTAN